MTKKLSNDWTEFNRRDDNSVSRHKSQYDRVMCEWDTICSEEFTEKDTILAIDSQLESFRDRLNKLRRNKNFGIQLGGIRWKIKIEEK